jgi:hypothetical protein
VGEGILVDTDVLIEYSKGLIELPYVPLYITEITLYEFIRGTKDINKAKKALEEGFIVLFHNNEAIKKASEIWIGLKKSGHLIDDRDLLIAAVAITNNLKLLTKNIRHFRKLEKFGLRLYAGK